MSPAIETQKLFKSFRSVQAIRSLSLSVPEKSIFALVGANGAGKTTTIKILMNIIRPTGGRALVLSKPSITLSGADFTRIGYVSENQEMPEWMRIGDFLRYLRAFYPSWDREWEERLVRRFNLPLDRKLKTLSRGMRMKVALASSLAYHPELIVLDEPFSGLDPLVREELRETLLESSAEATIFISSHDLPEIEDFATHVGYLEDGAVLFAEEMRTLRERFREIEVRAPHAPATVTPASSWIHLHVSGNLVRFVETDYRDDTTPGMIRAVLGHDSELRVSPMTLREIFVAVARSQSDRRIGVGQ